MYFRVPVNPEAPRPSFPKWAFACLAAPLLSGCLYTSQHFNSGRILEPGETSVTLGYGKAHFLEAQCPDQYDVATRTASDPPVCRSWYAGGGLDGTPGYPRAEDSILPVAWESINTPKFSLGYRLGVRKQWGPLTGIELGWTLEAPTNPISLEFDLKVGLPSPKAWKVDHSLSGGWGIGMWADNSWFLEYAASKTLGNQTFYLGYRYTALATQPQDLEDSFEEWKFAHRPRDIQQASLGWFFRLPEIAVIPDFLGPQVTVTTPMLTGLSDAIPSTDRDYDLNLNLGFGWEF